VGNNRLHTPGHSRKDKLPTIAGRSCCEGKDSELGSDSRALRQFWTSSTPKPNRSEIKLCVWSSSTTLLRVISPLPVQCGPQGSMRPELSFIAPNRYRFTCIKQYLPSPDLIASELCGVTTSRQGEPTIGMSYGYAMLIGKIPGLGFGASQRCSQKAVKRPILPLFTHTTRQQEDLLASKTPLRSPDQLCFPRCFSGLYINILPCIDGAYMLGSSSLRRPSQSLLRQFPTHPMPLFQSLHQLGPPSSGN